MDWKIILTSGLAVLGIITTIVLSFRLLKNKKPAWAHVTQRLIGRGTNAPRELKVFFSGREVQQVCITDIIFFNRGREVIKNEDVTDAITIQLPNAHILKPPVIYPISKEENRFRVRKRRDTVILGFKYLGYKDGAAIQVLHDGEPETVPVLNGNVMDADIKDISPFVLPSSNSGIRHIAGYLIMLVLCIGFASFIIFGGEPSGTQFSWPSSPGEWAEMAVTVAFFLVILIFTLQRMARELLKYYKFPLWIRRRRRELNIPKF